MAEQQATPKDRRYLRRLGELGGRTIVILVILALVVAACYRARIEFDWSADNRFSLQPALVEIISNLENDVEIIGIWPRGGESSQEELIEFIEAGTQQIADASSQLRFRHLDSIIDQPGLDAFKQQHGEAIDFSLYVLGQGRPFRIPLTWILRYKLQRELGGAIIAVSQSERIPVYVLQGHGMIPANDTIADAADSCSQLLRRFELAGFDVRTGEELLTQARLSRIGSIPNDGILLIPGPTRPLGSETVALIEQYLVDGGRVLLLGNYELSNDLAILLRHWNVLIARGITLERDRIFSTELGLPGLVIRSIDHSLRSTKRDFSQLLLDREFGLAPGPIAEQTASTGKAVMSPDSTPIRLIQRSIVEAEDPELKARFA